MPRKPLPATEPPQVGERIQQLRLNLRLTLDELSRRAGVSKSMLSQIERNQANPTVAVVWRLANALGVTMTDLLGAPPAREPAIVTVPVHATPTLRTPDQRCELRILGPSEMAGHVEWYELTLQPGGALESQPHEPGSREHLSVLSGCLEVVSGEASQKLKAGETARYAVDVAHAIRNPSRTVATALLVVVHP